MKRSEPGPTVSLQRSLLLLIAAALLAGVVPAGVALDRRLAGELEARARADLALAPRVLTDRNAAIADAMMMHAKDLAQSPGLAEALARRDRIAALRVLERARGSFGDQPLLVHGDGEVWAGGPAPDSALVAETRRGKMPVAVASDDAVLRTVALAPVELDGAWIGAAGVTLPLDGAMAGTLAGITRSDVLILGARGALAAATTNDTVAAALATAAAAWPDDGRVRGVRVEGGEYLVAKAPLGDVATVVFVRDLARELALMPKLRRVVALSGLGALGIALLLGAILAARLARPVRSLAAAADRLADGDFAAPLEPSRIREVRRVTHAFDTMRRALAARLAELGSANRELADRQERLVALQSELIQRERLAASGRLVAELAHEIRNPVASLRNCLELIHRRLRGDPEGQEFASMAIDELLRMHELAERMLDLNRPRGTDVLHCDATAVAREIAALARVGVAGGNLVFTVSAEGEAYAAIPPDALKQVLLNLVQNARDAVPHSLEIEIVVRREASLVSLEVTDNGPGIPPDVLPHVFDPFFTTKDAVGGVGLGLFVAEGIVRAHGGRMTASNRAGGGARFRIELLPAEVDPPGTPGPSDVPQTLEVPR